MQVVIDIDDEMYEQIVTNDDVYVLDDVDCILIENAIANGTPLPKGHGRLIDADDLLDRIGLEDNDSNRENNVGEIITLEDFDLISTIVEADKESEEE